MGPESIRWRLDVLRFFCLDHLPERLQAVSRPFSELAVRVVDETRPGGEEQAALALQHLLTAKDAAVRAAL